MKVVLSSPETFMANVLCSIAYFWGKLVGPSSGSKKIQHKGEESDAPLPKQAHTGEKFYEGSCTSLSFSFRLDRMSVPSLRARPVRAVSEYWHPGNGKQRNVSQV